MIVLYTENDDDGSIVHEPVILILDAFKSMNVKWNRFSAAAECTSQHSEVLSDLSMVRADSSGVGLWASDDYLALMLSCRSIYVVKDSFGRGVKN